MLNLQQTKLLSALLSSTGITDNYNYYVEGYKYSLTFEIVEELEAITELNIKYDEILVEAANGTVDTTLVYRIDVLDLDHAQSIFNNQIDTFHKNGTSVGFLK